MSNSKVDAFLAGAEKWRDEFYRLREIALSCGLTEEFKWGWPCYAHNKKNVVLIHGFKEYCALMFFNGALLKDPDHILIQQTENMQATRQIRFRNVSEIDAKQVKAYIEAAIDVEKAGLKVVFKKTSDFKVVEEFQARLDADPALKAAFEALTPGRQRAWLLHFSTAKQAKTREARIDKAIPDIFAGKGTLN